VGLNRQGYLMNTSVAAIFSRIDAILSVRECSRALEPCLLNTLCDAASISFKGEGSGAGRHAAKEIIPVRVVGVRMSRIAELLPPRSMCRSRLGPQFPNFEYLHIIYRKDDFPKSRQIFSELEKSIFLLPIFLFFDILSSQESPPTKYFSH